MNIYANHGDRVIFSNPKNGTEYDQSIAVKYLNLDESYEIDHTDVHSWTTHVYLTKFPGVVFNSVMFENDPANAEPTKLVKVSQYRITRVANHYKKLKPTQEGIDAGKTASEMMETVSHPYIDVNTVYEGRIEKLPEIGESITVDVDSKNGEQQPFGSFMWSTPVIKIEGDLYYTKNSVYQVTKIQYNK